MLELGGIHNVLAKSLGTTNPINMAKATVVALKELRRPEDVATIRGKQISEVLPLPAAKREEPQVEEAAAAVVAVSETAEAPVAEVAEVPAATSEKPKKPRSRKKKDEAAE